MPLPAGVQSVTITGGTNGLRRPDGTPFTGTVTVTPSVDRVVSTLYGMIALGSSNATLNASGGFTLGPILATNASGFTPGWTYRIDEAFTGEPPRSYSISLPAAAPTVALPDLTPVTASNGTIVQLPAVVSVDSLTGAVDLTGRYLQLAGGALTGNLTASGYVMTNTGGGSQAYTALPKGNSVGSNTAALVLGSSFGGEDDGTGTDSTGRLALYSYQRASTYGFGETIRNFLMRKDAKAMTAWYGPQSGTAANYDVNRDWTAGSSPKAWCWTGAHYEANDHASIHGHWEIEIPDATGALQGRLEVPFVDQENSPGTIGVAVTNIRTNLADFSVRASNGQVLRVGAANAHNKDILLSISSDRATSGRRWAIRANSTTETGLNVGTDFQLLTYDDTGTLITQALHAERKTGNIGMGTVSPDSRLHVKRASGQVLHVETGAAAQSAILVDGFDTTVKALQAQVTGDTQKRFQVLVDGTVSWGTGAATQDANLYRAAVGRLKTDTAFHIGTNMLVNTTSVGGGVGVIGVANAAALPTATPAGGGVLYAEGGALKWKGSSGTITVIAPA